MIAHAIAYVAITTSFNVHVIVRTVILGSGDGGAAAAAQNYFAPPWFGASPGMSALWGIELFIHFAGSVLSRGWED